MGGCVLKLDLDRRARVTRLFGALRLEEQRLRRVEAEIDRIERVDRRQQRRLRALATCDEIARLAATIGDPPAARRPQDRTSVVSGKGGSVRVDRGGRRYIKKKKKN